jgi:hypothetical protein
MATLTDQLEELLADAGVGMGKPEKRREIAVRLTNEGCSRDDLQELQSWAFRVRRKAHTVGQWLGWTCGTQARWQATLADVRRLRAKIAPATPTNIARQDALQTPEDLRIWQRGWAWCRTMADKAPAQTVAQELGIDERRVHELIAEEQSARQPEPAAPTTTTNDEDY